MSVQVLHGDCLELLPTLSGLDSCVCDPPYELGFMGREWDRSGVAFQPETWALVLAALKPGAHMLCFGGTRTFHRMACAIEDAGFEIRDTLTWLYGTGFPKSHDVSKGIDKAAGAVREVVSEGAPIKRMIPGADQHKDGWVKDNGREFVPTVTAPATPEAAQWQGWGTALKPAFEPIILARKPLDGTVAANVLRHGTGAINVDACRIGTTRGVPASHSKTPANVGAIGIGARRLDSEFDSNIGRWPANVLHDGSEEVEAAFGESRSGVDKGQRRKGGIWSPSQGEPCGPQYGDSGSASRFFYSAKADADDRAWSRHPTVKPIALMRWLVRLITPRGGTVLDCFAGSGTTGEAARLEGFNAILIEREAEYVADIRKRLGRAAGDDTPLFAGIS